MGEIQRQGGLLWSMVSNVQIIETAETFGLYIFDSYIHGTLSHVQSDNALSLYLFTERFMYLMRDFYKR